MAILTAQQVLKDKQTHDRNSITSLSLTHKALSDVSCLSEFTNLERLDLAFNNLTSLEGLRLCTNLKWLSVVQNKLQSLKGIEGLSKLTVLNAGKNKLKSMDEVKSLVAIRALVLNDNQIVSICRLDQLKELNTLVLSRNPVREIGDSLSGVKTITKLSLSNCQLQSIDTSLKSCIELKELRLAHNDIKILPAELACNKKLQNLDLGNNVITRWSDVKVLNSLVDLKILNLQGNPISENDKLPKKVQKLLPNLHVFNARPLEKNTKSGSSDRLIPDKELEAHKEMKKDDLTEKNSSKHVKNQKKNKHFDTVSDLDIEKKKNKTLGKHSKMEEVQVSKSDDNVVEKKLKRKKSWEDQHDDDWFDKEDSKQKRKKADEKLSKKHIKVHEDVVKTIGKKLKNNSREEQSELDIIDDGEAPFADLITADAAESPQNGDKKKIDSKAAEVSLQGGLVTFSAKKRKTKNQRGDHEVRLPMEVEVGMGGPSTWDDD